MSNGLLWPLPSGLVHAVRGSGREQPCGCRAMEVRDFQTFDEAEQWVRAGQYDAVFSEEDLKMGIFVGAKRYENAPEGIHAAVCCDVQDLGLVKTKFGEKQMVKLSWQIEATNKDGKRFVVSQRYTASLDPKANLRKALESWRGRKFTAAEEEKFDLENVLGAPAQVQIVHNPGEGGKVYANVENVLPLAKGMDRISVVAYVRVKDRVQEDTPPEDQAQQDQELADVPF